MCNYCHSIRLHALELQIGSLDLSWSDRSMTRDLRAIRSDHPLASSSASPAPSSSVPSASPSAAQIGNDGSRTLGVVIWYTCTNSREIFPTQYSLCELEPLLLKCHTSAADRKTEAQTRAYRVNDHLQCFKYSSPTPPVDSSCSSTPVAPRLLLLLDFFSPSTPPALRILLLLLDTCCSSTPVAP